MLNGKITIVKGPQVWFPGAHDEGRRGKAITITSTEYIMVRDGLTGNRHIVKGPCVWYPGPYEDGSSETAISLNSTEYLTVEDIVTGKRRLVKGPCNWFPDVDDKASVKKTAIALQDDEYIKVKDTASGKQWIARGEQVVFLEPTWEVSTGVKKAWSLKAFEYVRLHDKITGKTTVHRGEQTVFPGPHDELLDGKKMTAIDLKVHEYVKILDQATSKIRVVQGPETVFLEANERMIIEGKSESAKCKAVEIDDEHAVLVRDKSTGKLRLVTEKQLFIPAEHEKIEEVRELIKLADHEAMILKDANGDFQYYYGSEEKRGTKPRSFFLPPYSEIVGLNWSRGRKRDQRGMLITRFDCRPQYMKFEFNCRTSDNVELVLEGTFFWEVVDLPKMVSVTGDTSGDLCNHARSQFMKMVSKVTLKDFMETLHDIARKVHKDDPSFYEKRGVKVHSLEMTSYHCADRSTSEILEQIIHETTNRINRLSQQESENEVNVYKIQGQIKQEELNSNLLKIQQEHQQEESRVNGIAEAECVSAFMSELNEEIPDRQERIKVWETLRKNDALSVISAGDAQMYYTPNDVKLSIKTNESKK
jgi:regulator of protease activity HflC (stomatin/prohibitin superfamily)